jgi:rhodanese-related sulfurtransferase
MKRLLSAIAKISLSLALVSVMTLNSVAANAPRLSKDELLQMLDNPELVVADVRTGRDWMSSEFKIKGAVRVDYRQVVSWASKYGKDNIIVFYCA